MPRKPIGEKPMSDAERQARYRAARAAGTPITRTRRPADHRSRARRWHDAVAELTQLQAQYADWLEALPDALRDGATAEALQAICDLDLSDIQAIQPPRGFGRD
jgi:hypothetical protein